MPTSGSIDFVVNRDDIITESLEILGVLGEGETPNADQLTSASRTLNMLVKTWQADGLQLNAVQRLYLFLEKTVSEYSLLSTTVQHFTTSFEETTVAVAATSGASTITVTDATGFLNGDNIGVGSGTDVQWTIINGTPASNVITLTDVLVNAAAVGDVVYAYTTKANRPMHLLEGYIHINNGTDIPMGQIPRERYFDLSVKDASGISNQFYYDRKVSPTLFLWPETDDERSYAILLAQRTLEDFDAASDIADFPQEWYLPLAYNLAVLTGPKFGTPSTQFKQIAILAEYYYEMARGYDIEHETSVYFRPDKRGEEIG